MPAGIQDADGLVARAREAMKHPATGVSAVTAQDGQRVVHGLAAVDDQGQRGPLGQIDLLDEGLLLRFGIAEIVVVVQSRLADGHDLAGVRQPC